MQVSFKLDLILNPPSIAFLAIYFVMNRYHRVVSQ